MDKKIVIDSRYNGKSGICQVKKGFLDSIDNYKDFVLIGKKDLLMFSLLINLKEIP